MSDTTEITTIEKTVKNLFKQKTPAKAIKHRPGANGLSFPYVEMSWILSQLNEHFGIFWEFKVVDKSITEKYVWVQGELIIKSPSGFSISRPGFGGTKIKVMKATGESVDIANDIKAATTLALRKAASLFGIGADVAYKELDQYEQAPEVIVTAPQEEIDGERRARYMGRLFATAAERGFDSEEVEKTAHKKFKVDSMTLLSLEQISEMTDSLIEKYKTVGKGNKPEKIDSGETLEGEIVEEKTPHKSLCINPKCVNGEGKSRKENVPGEIFCSKECRKEYESPMIGASA